MSCNSQGNSSSSLHCSHQRFLYLPLVTGQDAGTTPEGTDPAWLFLTLFEVQRCTDVQIYRREASQHGAGSHGSCHQPQFLWPWGTPTRAGGLQLSFQLVLVSRRALFKTCLLLVFLLHPHAETVMAKDKHSIQRGLKTKVLKANKAKSLFLRYILSQGFCEIRVTRNEG